MNDKRATYWNGGTGLSIILAALGSYGLYRAATVPAPHDVPQIVARGASELDLFNIDGADTSGERGGLTYAEYDDERDAAAIGNVFEGFVCLGSCDGHAAGWSWAAESDAAGPEDCGGNSWSFAEGCVAYVRANDEAPDRPERPHLGLY